MDLTGIAPGTGLWLVAPAAFLLAGTIKGTVGLGFPTIAIGILTFLIEPRLAIALTILPTTVTNLVQIWRAGDTARTARTYLPFLVTLLIFVALATWASTGFSRAALTATVGGVVVVFSVLNLVGRMPRVPDRYDLPYQIATGAIGGVIGGITSLYAVPVAMYLLARGKGPADFVRAGGLMVFVGTLPLLAGYLIAGFLDGPGLAFSAMMILPAMLGFRLGEFLRARLSPALFRKIFLWLFLGLGLKLIADTLV